MRRLQPFFCFYGGKWRAAPRYPQPEHDTIIEPFAGAAGYATRHADRKVIIVERDPIIAALWRYLTRVSTEEVRRLPLQVESTDALDVCAEAKSLIGFWLNKGTTHPRKTPSAWARGGLRPQSYWSGVIRERIAVQVESIRHWHVIEGSYEQAPDVTATWFIDPPYQVAGKCYRFRLDDYASLAEWCRARVGQVMVCENEGATWLPFKPFERAKSTPGARGKSYSTEVLWTNVDASPTLFDLMAGMPEDD